MLAQLGYANLMSVGPDHYFSNIEGALGFAQPALERALSRFIDSQKQESIRPAKGPIRRRIGPGLTVELSSHLSCRIRKVLRR